MRYHIKDIKRDSGEAVDKTIRAASEDEAREIAAEGGCVVESVVRRSFADRNWERIVIRAGIILLLLTLMVPPWQLTGKAVDGIWTNREFNIYTRIVHFDAGYRPFFAPPKENQGGLWYVRINWSRLILQCLIIATLNGGGWYFTRSREQQ